MRSFLAFLLLSVIPSHGQMVGAVVGRVLDATTRSPVAEVVVSVPGLGRSALTDSSGSFSLGPLPPGVYDLEARHVGYRVCRMRVAVSAGETHVDLLVQPRVLEADEVVVTATRAVPGVTPATFTDLSQALLRRSQAVKDPPALLQEEVPNVYSYSDAGHGVGYSYLRIRGFDQKRINVTINGVPLNDPEDHQVYWVDMPDLLATTQDIQVQRGVGTALVGQYGLGGSVNILTQAAPEEPGIRLRGGLGSWGTRLFSFQVSSVGSDERALLARFSRIISKGYRERTDSDLWAYYLAGTAVREGLRARFAAYGGPIKTHAGWYAAHEESLRVNRRFNPVRYENEIDSFHQPHYELELSWRGEEGEASSTLFYVRGRGYYEQFKERRRLRDYGLVPVDDDTTRADLIRQKHVDKDHVGWLPRASRTFGPVEVAVGGELSRFWSTHYGEVLWTSLADSLRGEYYRYKGVKWTGSGFLHTLTHLGPRLDLLADLSAQWKEFSFRQLPRGNFAGVELNRFSAGYTFLSPRVGLTVRPREGMWWYANVSVAHREPADEDYFDAWEGPDELFADPLFAEPDTVVREGEVRYVRWYHPLTEPEKLVDYEVGAGWETGGFRVGCALYLMDFRNEIIPYGRFDQERGAPVTGNAARTVHKGVELDLASPDVRVGPGAFGFKLAAALSENVLEDFTSFETWEPEGEDRSGNPIPLFPDRLMTLRGHYRYRAVELGGRTRYVGRQFLDTTGERDRTIAPYSLVDAWLKVGPFMVGSAGTLRVELKVDNLTDRAYETSGYYDPWEGARYLWVGAPRTLWAGITWDL